MAPRSHNRTSTGARYGALLFLVVLAITACTRIPEEERAVRQKLARGTALRKERKRPEALQVLDEARRDAEKLLNPKLRGEITLQWAAVEERQKAIPVILRAIDEVLPANQPLLEAQLRGQAGFILAYLSRFGEGLGQLEQALPLAERSNDRLLTEKILGNLAWCYYSLGEYELALEASERARDIAASLSEIDEQLERINTIGAIHYRTGQLGKSAAAYEAALRLLKDQKVKWSRAGAVYDNLAVLALERKELDKAAEFHRRAEVEKQGTLDQASLLQSQLVTAQIEVERKDYSGALVTLAAILQVKDGGPIIRSAAHSLTAEAYLRQGRLPQAEAEYRAGILETQNALQHLNRDESRLGFLSRQSDLYSAYAKFLIGQRRLDEALIVLDEGRSPNLGAAKVAGKLDPHSIARSHGATILVYWLQPEKSFVWAISAEDIVLHELPPRHEITAAVTAHTTAIGNGSLQPTSTALFEMLVGRALSKSLRPGRLIVIHDDALHRLSFDTLIHKPGSYWIEEATITRAPSLRALASESLSRPGSRLLVIGNPDLEKTRYARLPRAGEEIHAVADAYGVNQTTLIEGPLATSGAYLEELPKRYGLLHFVGHGVASEKRPLDSALILSNGNRLEARDIIRHPIQARLVTLGACYTAGTRVYRGAGLIGLGWAFLRAGAQGVVAGLWEINDSAAVTVHSGMYRLIRQNKSPVAALREARLGLLRSNSPMRQPFYWGAWTYMEGQP